MRHLSFTSIPPRTGADAGIYELRTYTLHPHLTFKFLQHAEQNAELRLKLFPHLLGFFSSDVGGCLHQVKHLYHYQDLDHRERVRRSIAQDAAWKRYLPESQAMVSHTEAMLYVEATDCHHAAAIPSAVDFGTPARAVDTDAPQPVYELRTYQCHLGYDTVPKLRAHIAAGLPSKVQADTHGQLVLYAFTDVGQLNNVIELWRFPSMQGSLRARQASRAALPWREAIGKVAPLAQTFTSQFFYPSPFSPWQ